MISIGNIQSSLFATLLDNLPAHATPPTFAAFVMQSLTVATRQRKTAAE
jgi:hypothetical protein